MGYMGLFQFWFPQGTYLGMGLLGHMGFPNSSVGKESACNAGDPDSIPGLGRSPGEGNGNLLQYSCLKNPMDREAWRATVYGVARVRHDLATKPLAAPTHRCWLVTWSVSPGHPAPPPH